MRFSNVGEEISMCHFKEIENGCKNMNFDFLEYRTSFSGMLKVVLSEPSFQDQP